jgi:hypothetical protein
MTRRGLAIGALVGVLSACGHWGPPVRSQPARTEAPAAPAPPGAEPAQPSDDAQKERHGP